MSPAIVKTPTWDSVAWNAAAVAVLGHYGARPENERNLLRMLFEDSKPRIALHDWEDTGRLRPHRVVTPAQRERRHPAVPGGQPARHLQQEAPRAEQQCWRELYARHEFQLLVEARRQLNPRVRFGSQAVGLVEGAEQLRIEPTAHASSRQSTDLAQRLHP